MLLCVYVCVRARVCVRVLVCVCIYVCLCLCNVLVGLLGMPTLTREIDRPLEGK